jgi:orotidine-5'-phosphate decarboxylase
MSQLSISDPRIIVALDFPDQKSALDLVELLDPELCRVKVGKELFTRCGPGIVIQIQKMGYEVFLDLKFHDIPNTTAAAVTAAAELGVWMINVHASGGESMLTAARKAMPEKNNQLLIGVTVLTSMDARDLVAIGIGDNPVQQVLRLAKLCKLCGLDGVVCSSQEAPLLRRELGEDFLLVTPGIRPAGDESGDQKRIVSPTQAINNGSSYLVIGRPVSQSDNPRQKLIDINKEISGNF